MVTKKNIIYNTVRELVYQGDKMATKIDSLESLFYALLCDIYFVENKLVRDALPAMASKAYSKELKEAITTHLHDSKMQVERLEKCFHILDIKPERIDWMETINTVFEKAGQMISSNVVGHALDAAIIVAAQRVEHYEMATYGSLIEFADTLGYSEVKSILKDTLKEECRADEVLTKLASGTVFKKGINAQAVHS